MMSPEESMRIQKAINSDIVMQLDDVVSGFFTKPNGIEYWLAYPYQFSSYARIL